MNTQTSAPLKTQFVVIDENKLCCLVPGKLHFANVLSASIIRGACDRDGICCIPMDKKDMRPATRQDFETFRVHSEGFEKDTEHYEFPTE